MTFRRIICVSVVSFAGWWWGGEGYSYILAICVCATGKGMVFKGIWSGIGSSNHTKKWSSIGSCLKGSLTKD